MSKSQESLSTLKREVDALKGIFNEIKDPSVLPIKKLLREEDKRVLTNEVNIEKLKELVILLNKEIINYRNQVKAIGKNKDVLKAIEDIDKKFDTIEKDKSYTDQMVKRVHEISKEVNQKFGNFQESNEKINALNEKLDSLAESFSTTKEKTSDIVTNKELKEAISDYKDHMSHQIRTLHDQIHKGQTDKIQEIQLEKAQATLDSDHIKKEVTQQLMEHHERVQSEIDNLKQFVSKNVSNQEKSNVIKAIQHIEDSHVQSVQQIHGDIGKEQDHIVKQKIDRASNILSTHLSGLREHVKSTALDLDKVHKLKSALHTRKFRKAESDEKVHSEVNISLGQLKENNIKDHQHVREDFQHLKEDMIHEDVQPESNKTRNTVSDEINNLEFAKGVGTQENQLHPQLEKSSLGHLKEHDNRNHQHIREDFQHLKEDMIHEDTIPHIKDSIQFTNVTDRRILKLQEMIQGIYVFSQQGHMSHALKQYQKAYDYYLILNNKGNIDLKESYNALISIYHKIK